MAAENGPRPTERIAVDFAGEGEGSDELSWGMWEIWNAMCRQRSALPIGGRAPLEPGTTVADLAAELSYLMGRFPSMRTRLVFGAEGRTTQQLFGAGRIDLDVYDAEPDADPEDVAAAVEQHYRDTEFDYAGQWPVRMGAVRHRGAPTHLVTVMHHLVTDALGGALMLREVKARETAPVTGLQQLEQARWQNSPAGQRQNERSLRHWESVLRTVPARQLPGPTDPRTPRHWSGFFRSPALDAALPGVVARTGAEIPTVLLGLYAYALHQATGISPVVFRPIVNNRFRSALSDVVCMVAQAGVCVLDLEGATLEQAVEKAGRSSMSAYKHAYFHPNRLVDLVERVSRERGEDVSIGSFFNDRTARRPDPAAPLPPAQDLHELRAQTSFAWTLKEDTQTERFFVNADDGPDGTVFEIRIDTHFVSPGEAEDFAAAMEAAAVAAAGAEASDRAVAAPAAGAESAAAVAAEASDRAVAASAAGDGPGGPTGGGADDGGADGGSPGLGGADGAEVRGGAAAAALGTRTASGAVVGGGGG